MRLGEIVKEYREKCGFSRSDLATQCSVSASTVTFWEQGRRFPRDVRMLEGILGVNFKEFDLEDYPHDKTRNLLMADSDYININSVIRIFKKKLGTGINFYRIRRLIQKEGLPAYENPFKRNSVGDPTLLFKEKEVTEWIENKLRPVNTVLPR